MDRKDTEDGNKRILETGSKERQEGNGWERVSLDHLDLQQAEIHLEVGKEHLDKVGIPEERRIPGSTKPTLEGQLTRGRDRAGHGSGCVPETTPSRRSTRVMPRLNLTARRMESSGSRWSATT